MERMTALWLIRHKACSEQVAIFEREWPEGAELTVENVTRAGKLGLDCNYLFFMLSSGPSQMLADAIAPASDRYWEARRAWALGVGTRTEAQARATYYDEIAPALVEALRAEPA